MSNDPINSCCKGVHEVLPPGPDTQYMDAALLIEPASAVIREELASRLVPISGGLFEMGARKSTYPVDMDSPRRKVRLSPYAISPLSVSNADYARFVEATGYRTIAEREGWSFVFHLLLANPARYFEHPPGLRWWRKVEGACWSAPEGPGSDWHDRTDHPVVQVSWFDAIAYCRWAGLRLPTEAEWECAARGGLQSRKFPWGNELTPGGRHAMNVWQGSFPGENSADDGFVGTAPVTAFQPNGYGLYNTTGNVWEWVQDFAGPRPKASPGAEHDPKGPSTGSQRVQRGGSYLCHESYCDRYHVHSRTKTEPDSSTGNCGFRVAGPSPVVT